MTERKVFVVFANFYLLHLHSEFLKNTCEGEEDLKLAKENVHADIFHRFDPLGNL